MYDLDPVAIRQQPRVVPAAGHDLSVDLHRDPAYEALLTGSSPFAELPDVLPRLASGELPALCHTIDYPEA